MNDDTPLASLSLTHVHYVAGDPMSYLAAWLSLVPQALCVAYLTLLWATREAEVGLMFMGQMSCEVLNSALKRLIKEDRPTKVVGKGYGMPSSHAQFLAYFATYLGLFLLVRHRPSPHQTRGKANESQPLPLPSPRSQLRIQAAAVLLLAAGVAGARVYLHYHTPTQVMAGVGAGTVFGIVWFYVVHVVRAQGLLRTLIDSSLARQFRVRDLVCEQDLHHAGWMEWEGKKTVGKGKKKL